MYPNPDLSAEEEIVHKIAEMSVKLQHIDTLNDQRKLDLQGISRQFSSLVRMVKDHQDQYENNNSSLNKKLAEYSKQGGKMWCFKDYTYKVQEFSFSWLQLIFQNFFRFLHNLTCSIETFLSMEDLDKMTWKNKQKKYVYSKYNFEFQLKFVSL